VAFASHSSKAATRLVANQSPEPFSNIAISLLEDGLAPLGVWLSFIHPVVVFVMVLVFLAAFLWLAPKVVRAVTQRLSAFWRWLRGRPSLP
jgi:hypothetical protein